MSAKILLYIFPLNITGIVLDVIKHIILIIDIKYSGLLFECFEMTLASLHLKKKLVQQMINRKLEMHKMNQ